MKKAVGSELLDCRHNAHLQRQFAVESVETLHDDGPFERDDAASDEACQSAHDLEEMLSLHIIHC